MTDREEFEAWISAPPFEHMRDRHSDHSAWPGNYKRYETQLAWCAWQDGRKKEREACAKICEEVGSSKWAYDDTPESYDCARLIRDRNKLSEEE